MELIGNIPIYYINLKRSVARNEKMIETFNKYNIKNYIRIEAVDGTILDLTTILNYNKNITKYEVACSLSHIKAIDKAYNDNCDYAIIMEDDCNFEYLKYKKIPIIDLFNEISDCELLQLAIICRQDHNLNIVKTMDKYKKGYRNSTAAYIINKKGMEKIINYYKNNKQIEAADYYLYNGINSYYCYPYFTYYYSSDFRTTIHDNSDYLHKREDSSKEFWDNFYVTNNK